jgi:hypothetical protein
MSGVALDVPVSSTQPRSFWRLLWAVLVGYFLAAVTLLILALPLLALGWLPRPFARPGPFPVDGAWSLDADLVVAAFVVLSAAWWIWREIAYATRGPVSFGVVTVAVALTGYAPFLALRPAALSGIVALPATTWIIRRYAVGTTLPFAKPSWRVWLVFALVGVVVLGSYRAYHPLTATNYGLNGWAAGGKQIRRLALENSDWANLTILRVDGGSVGPAEGWMRTHRLPYTVRSRAQFGVYVVGRACVPRDVIITFSVLGRTSSQRFAIEPYTVRPGFSSSNARAC